MPPAHKPAPQDEAATALTGQVGHYENFPVASWLCPPALRPAIAAIYHFARTADDIADEGHASAEQRLADLAQYRAELTSALASSDQPPTARCTGVAARCSVHRAPQRWGRQRAGESR